MLEEEFIHPEVIINTIFDCNLYQIKIYMPGVERERVLLNIYHQGFFVKGVAKTILYIGFYILNYPIETEKVLVNYEKDLLIINAPFKNEILNNEIVETLNF